MSKPMTVATLASMFVELTSRVADLETREPSTPTLVLDNLLEQKLQRLDEENRALRAEVERAHARLDACHTFLAEKVLPRLPRQATARSVTPTSTPPAPEPVESDPSLAVYGNGPYYQFVKTGVNTTTRRPVHGPARPALSKPEPKSEASAQLPRESCAPDSPPWGSDSSDDPADYGF